MEPTSTADAVAAPWAQPSPGRSVPAFHSGGDARRTPVSSSFSEEARGLLSTSPHVSQYALSAAGAGSPGGGGGSAAQRAEAGGRAAVDYDDATRRVLFEGVLVSVCAAVVPTGGGGARSSAARSIGAGLRPSRAERRD